MLKLKTVLQFTMEHDDPVAQHQHDIFYLFIYLRIPFTYLLFFSRSKE